MELSAIRTVDTFQKLDKNQYQLSGPEGSVIYNTAECAEILDGIANSDRGDDFAIQAEGIIAADPDLLDANLSRLEVADRRKFDSTLLDVITNREISSTTEGRVQELFLLVAGILGTGDKQTRKKLHDQAVYTIGLLAAV